MRWLLALLALAASEGATPASQPAADQPRVEGTLEVNPQTGLFSGALCVRGVGPVRRFLLTRGLNIRAVRDAATNQSYGFDVELKENADGDAETYTLDNNASANGVCVDYVGLYPVYRLEAGERAASDWKGMIAFDGRNVRATEQTRFYPVVLRENGEQLNQLTYDIDVRCPTCTAIYMNGSAPQQGQRAHFVSSTPRPLLLYAGDFPISSDDGVYFIGASASPAAARSLSSGLAAIRAAHEAYMGVPIQDHPAMLSFAVVSREGQWDFTTWPTIASSGGMTFDELARGGRSGRFSPQQERYMAHEMAHYYFGTLYRPRGKMRWFMLESTAEYLSAIAVRRLQGQAAYRARLRSFATYAPTNPTPLNQIATPDDIDVDYRYSLGPMLWVAMANALGESVVQRTLIDFVRHPPQEDVDYVLLRTRLVAAGAGEAGLQRFETACLQAPLPAACNALAGAPVVHRH